MAASRWIQNGPSKVPVLSNSAANESLGFGPDGTWLVSASLADCRLRVWDVATGRLRKEIGLPCGNLRSVMVRPDGRRLAARDADTTTVLLFDAQTHESKIRLHGHEKFVWSAAFSRFLPDGYSIVTGLRCVIHQSVRRDRRANRWSS
jgi:WD40 repeat protein